MQAAADMVEAERLALVNAAGGDLPLHEFMDASENARKDFLWLPSQVRQLNRMLLPELALPLAWP